MLYFFQRLKARCNTVDVLWGLALPSFVLGLLGLVVPVVMLQTYDRIIPNKAYSTLAILVVIAVVALLLEMLLKVLRSVIGAWADSRFEHMTGNDAFVRMLNAKSQYFDEMSAGAYLDKMSSIGRLKDFYTGQLIVSTIDVPFIVLFILLMAYIAGWIALVPVVMLVIYGALSHQSNISLRDYIEQRQVVDDKRTSFIIETLGHIGTLKANAMEEMLLSRYDSLLEHTALIDHKMVMISGKKTVITQMVSQVNLLLIVGFGALAILNGALSLGALAASSFLANRIMQPVGRISGLWTRLQSIRYAEERLQVLKDLPSESSTHEVALRDFKGNLEFRDIELQAGNRLNLNVKSGEIIALVGDSLTGKTHLMMMVQRMADIPAGDILLDGESIQQFTPHSIRSNIQYVTQDPILYDGTLLENITLFREGEYVERAYEMCKELGLETFIQQLPNGYDTMLAQSSVELLPKGTRQRINIARALTADPKVILFDEANTAFDDMADYALMMALEKHRGEYTVIFVSPTYNKVIERADRAYLLKDGELNEYRAG